MAVKPLKALNERHHRFIAYYLSDFNATRAAKRAGFSEKSAYMIGYQLLQDPTVLDELKRKREALLNELQVDLSVLFREHLKVGFSDISHLMSWDDDGVHLIKSEDLTPHETAAIQELTITKRIFESENCSTTLITTKVKLHSKLKALDALCRLLPGLHGGAGGDSSRAGDDGEAGKGLASLLEAAKVLVKTAREDI